MKLYCLPCWCINCNCEKIIYPKVPYVKALGFDPGYLFQSLCSSLCATLSQCPSPSYLPGQYMCPYPILHLRKKSMMVQTATRDRIKSVTLILSLSLPIHKSLSPTTHDIAWTFGFSPFILPLVLEFILPESPVWITATTLGIFPTQWTPRSHVCFQSSPSSLPYHSCLEDIWSSD